jgi:uncharacterized protein YqgV (UPF0045/DUF77 family)
MTTQDLKDNRSEIIARINEIADASKMAEIMTAMVNLINGGMNEANNAIELVDEVVTLMGYQKKYTGRHMDDISAESMRNQCGSSMRY